MELDRNLLKEFAQITNDSTSEVKNTYLRGTIVKNSGGKYVQLDGSTTVTPISEIVDVEEGDRVLVSIENHKATIIGNFTFPPSARKEQEALNKAEDAKNTADGVAGVANAAQQKAQEASNKADTAINQSSIASASADEAKDQAQEAISKANTANENVQEAKDLATQASADATAAKNQAAASQASSAEAQAEVTRLQGEVDNAKENINGALADLEDQAGEIEAIKKSYATKVEVGNTKAELETTITTKVGELETTVSETYSTKTENVALEGRLQTQITQNSEGLASQVTKTEKLEADTTKAQQDVAEALSKANTAQSTANEAQSKANAAQSAANQASADAQAADNKAVLAKNAADAAQAAANAADQAVQAAQGDLNEAKQNLANVTSRVDATEADIAEAQSKVDAAQADVNQALADAAEANLAATKAQEAADQAQEDAETAQGVATTAQQKADNAKTAADNAQTAANKAQADVAALTSRVTTAETKISQNGEQITLNANKTEEIGNKLNNMQIGGRNYYTTTTRLSQLTPSVDADGESHNVAIYRPDPDCPNGFRFVGGRGDNGSLRLSNVITSNGDWTISFWVRGSQNTPVSFDIDICDKVTTKVTTTSDNTWKYVTFTGNVVNYTEDLYNFIDFSNIRWAYFFIKNLKIEKGNKPTDWTPAPEDIENELTTNYYTKTETDAKIKVESDRITSTVSKVETVEKTVNNLEIGGRNLLLNTSSPITVDGTAGGKYVYSYYSLSTALEENQKYMISADVEVLTGDVTKISVRLYDNPTVLSCGSVDLSITNGHIEGVIVPNTNYASATKALFYAGVAGSTAGNKVKFSNVKFEKGNKATDWTQAPEDVDESIANAQSAANNAQTAADNAQTDIDNLEIGSRNYFRGYSEEEIQLNDYQGVGSFTQFINCLTFDPCETVGETYTISFWAKSPNGVTPLRVYNSNGNPRHFRFNAIVTQNLGDEWEYFTITIINNDTGEDYPDTYCNRLEFYASSQLGVLVKKIKVEKGNRATDWTPAPEDIDESINNAQNTATNAEGIANSAQTSVIEARTLIQQLSDMISHLVTDDNGGSLMTQTSTGWTFNMSSISGNLEAIQEAMENMKSDHSDTNNALEKLTNLINDVVNKTAYITMTADENGDPCIELGKSDNLFKVRITNTAIDFLEGSTKIAYANNNTFYTEKLIVKNELQIGEGPGFVWRTRANGNMGLVYISG